MLTVHAGRCAYVHLARGSLTLGNARLHAGDGARVTRPSTLQFRDGVEAEVLVFDLPASEELEE
jgi:redox-sensitive bicupin YhaK (pirin superfamily)